MSQVVYDNIFDSIKKDDLTWFSRYIESNENLCFGRFPLLTICILYNAKKILKKYKNILISIEKYKRTAEKFEIYKKFKEVAGKRVRLYFAEKCIVSPIEMYAILNKNGEVKKLLKKLTINQQIVNNLQKIYFINNQSFEIQDKKIKISDRPLSRYQIRQCYLALFLSIIFIALTSAVYVAFGLINGFGLSWSYFKIDNEKQFLNALNGNSNICLTKNLVFNDNISIRQFNGNIDGNNYTIYINNVNENSLILQNYGNIKNLTIVYSSANLELENSFSMLIEKNHGNIENVNIICEKLELNCIKSKENDLYVNAFAKENYGLIKNCSLSINLDVKTFLEGECYVSGFAGSNYGSIENSIFNQSSKINTTSADASGFVTFNYSLGKVVGCKNYAEIYQFSDIAGWSPNVAGVVLMNYGAINKSINFAQLEIESTYAEEENQGTVFLGGVVCQNFNIISNCLNKANLNVNSNFLNVYCGGIVSYSTYADVSSNLSKIENCGVQGEFNINIKNESSFMFVGGICGYLYGEINYCYSTSTFKTGYDAEKYFVGTCLGSSYLQSQIFNNIICFLATDVFVLYQSNVEFQVGCLINNNSIVNSGFDANNNGINTIELIEDLLSKEVYWDE